MHKDRQLLVIGRTRHNKTGGQSNTDIGWVMAKMKAEI